MLLIFTNPTNGGKILKHHNIEVREVFNDYGDIFETADSLSIVETKRCLHIANVFIVNNERYVRVQSPIIIHEPEKKMVSADKGRIQICDTQTNEIIEDLYFNQLYLTLRDDEVGWTIIIKEALR